LAHPIKGSKALDFSDFLKASGIISRKEHLTPMGLENILLLKTGMNSNRRPGITQSLPLNSNNKKRSYFS